MKNITKYRVLSKLADFAMKHGDIENAMKFEKLASEISRGN